MTKPMKQLTRIVAGLFFIMISVLTVKAQDSLKFPTPTGNPNQLFFLQRSQNTNTVIYELNMKNGVLDTISPVHIFWICYAEKSQKEELTSIQRKYAYGITTKYVSKDHFLLTFAANKQYSVDLMRGPDHQFHVYAEIDHKKAILARIYLQIHGGSLFSPNVEYTQIEGVDAVSGAKVLERKKK